MTSARPVRIGLSSLDVAALPVFAEATGAFAARGVSVSIALDLGHPGEVVAMVAAGELDLGYADIVTSLRAVQSGADVLFLAPGGRYDDAEPIVVLATAASLQPRRPRDYQRATIVTPGVHDLARLGVRAWIERDGGDSTGTRFRSGIPMTRAADVLAAGEADAMIVSEPQRTLQSIRLAEAGAPFGAVAGSFIMGAYVASGTWCRREPSVASAVRDGITTTARWANRERRRTGEILAGWFGFSPDVLRRMRRATHCEGWHDELLAPILSAASAAGEIAPIAAADVASTFAYGGNAGRTS